ncbi:hypothetical protein F383_38282 [Gossypium arboreum]|uniref:Uncharacterized protein n=1 Tax=Gossypium arboreum TaxID=29729 RepID=A0A0B0MF47_GOSAR|nr:hypothetical protein F383_38282 [Gossypium arboreum]
MTRTCTDTRIQPTHRR